ncbi:hypothetical protein ACN6LA_003159, partial [Streptomyces sp. SAS_269]|uniref:hypothetical protein n=1 Tax=Streptomyces sp. SAS_269 TaxID=3412749 RepID=UPI00403C4AEF
DPAVRRHGHRLAGGHLFADTGLGAPHGPGPLGAEPELHHPGRYHLGPHTLVILVGRDRRTG